jgi:predicted RNA-binding protein with TRAM domain
MNEQEAPVKEGEEYKVKITSTGSKGDGIAKVNGFIIFVSGVKKGDYVKVKINKVLKNAAFATFVEKVEKPQGSYATITKEELMERSNEPKYDKYEDSEDFGEELEE